MRFKSRYGVSVVWACTAVLAVVWLAQRKGRPPGHQDFRRTHHGRILFARFRVFPLFLSVAPESSRETQPIVFQPLQAVSEPPGERRYTHGNSFRNKTDQQCMLNGRRALLGVNESASMGPFNNNSFAKFSMDGNVFFPSERFCAELITRRYFSEIDEVDEAVLSAVLQPVPVEIRPQHRCYHVSEWIGADCRIASVIKAVVGDCITKNLFQEYSQAQCQFAHLCCHQIQNQKSPFNMSFTVQSTPFTLTNQVFSASKLNETRNKNLFSLASYTTGRGYVVPPPTTPNALLPFENATNSNAQSRELWLELDEKNEPQPRATCTLEAVKYLNSASELALLGHDVILSCL